MTFPILVEKTNGKFVATMAGNPKVHAESATREAAVAAVKSLITEQVASGELTTVEVALEAHPLFGKFADDPTLQDICDEIYRQRDAEPKE